jgi:hypothetical protein
MRIRLLVCVTTILLAGTAWAQAFDCNLCRVNNCAPQFCQAPPPDLLVYECTGGGQPHFVIGDGTLLTEVTGQTASFSVAGLLVHTTIGNTVFAPFTIGTSEKRVRFTTSNGGECVEVKGLSGFINPSPIVVSGRALNVLKKAFFCREPARDLICFSVKGQVTGSPIPFPPLSCVPDRVEAACGVVS